RQVHIESLPLISRLLDEQTRNRFWPIAFEFFHLRPQPDFVCTARQPFSHRLHFEFFIAVREEISFGNPSNRVPFQNQRPQIIPGATFPKSACCQPVTSRRKLLLPGSNELR